MANPPFITKFRAFQLDSAGSLFSFFKKNTYTLIEARLPKGGIEVLEQDLKYNGKSTIDVLHITSWDSDHCSFDDLSQILNKLRPEKIEIPDYEPSSDTGELCRNILLKYDNIHDKYVHNVQVISKEYIRSLANAPAGGAGNVVIESSYRSDCKNDMSLIKLFRSVGFNVLSLGDCESPDIAKKLLTYPLLTSEVDVLILPHHGAHNGFIFDEFLAKLNPKVAVCSSNYGNQYDHPRQEIRDMLYEANIPIYTTKTGDIIITQREDESAASIFNLNQDNNGVSSQSSFIPKRYQQNN
ncbi:ComEC/Rec2 family competence protein [Mucilaginibacter aquaedulcis]|uniref:ComEC/Rec2 family competence protein n=1 Tax=Mucilaginibacter aquaedulcis TaxID=1187081 RepID=UPI0025B6003A|nr:hypothetical protein [Mucilaginibacter aquaedulcis]MDN3548959.1 hypothetical protein [Mucilaginibacter aquaedulcis]